VGQAFLFPVDISSCPMSPASYFVCSFVRYLVNFTLYWPQNAQQYPKGWTGETQGACP